MPGLVPGISLRRAQCRSIGMAGTSPAMTQSRRARLTAKRENIVTDIEKYDCSLRFSYVWRILAHDSDTVDLSRNCDRKLCRQHRRCRGDADKCLAVGFDRVLHRVQWRTGQDILEAMPFNIGAPERAARQCG
jgi:hypothetical protein